jgi:hypothetical protein
MSGTKAAGRKKGTAMKVMLIAVSLLSLASFACAATPASENDDVQVEVENRNVVSLGVDSACYSQCMDERNAPFPIDGTTSAQNPYGINPDWAADAYRNADGCYAQCKTEGTGRTPSPPTRKYKLKK